MLPAASLVSLLASPSPLAIASLISFIALRAATSPLGVFTPPPSLLTISPITSFTSLLLLATIALSTCSLISLLVAATLSVCAFASPSALRDSR